MLLKWKWIGLCLVGLLFLSSLDSANAAKSKKKKVPTIHSGASPAGATKWLSDSAGTIYTDVDLSHLNLDRIPRYLCTVTANSKRSGLIDSDKIKLSNNVFSSEGLALVNVTGKNYPRKVSAKGFRVRLKYTPEDGRNLTAAIARIGGWRVKWIAITNDHPIVKALIDENDDVELSYLTPASYIKMLESVVREEKAFTSGLFGRDYVLPLSQQPKPKPKPKPEGDKKADSEDSSKEAAEEVEAEPETEAEAEAEDDTNTDKQEEIEQ